MFNMLKHGVGPILDMFPLTDAGKLCIGGQGRGSRGRRGEGERYLGDLALFEGGLSEVG